MIKVKGYSSGVINGKKVICIIPARAGSVGIKHKNLKLIHGKSLVGWAVAIATKVGAIDEVVISTDSEEIAEEAKLHGGTFIKLRSPELSGPNVHDQQVLIETLANCEAALNSQFEALRYDESTTFTNFGDKKILIKLKWD